MMSNYSNNSSKKERENCLTLEQYEMIVAFLKHGIKPSRKSIKNTGLTGTQDGGPDGGKKKSPFVRFRSIAKRLTYRASDGELIFKANSKIILPKNRFEDTILTAHKSNGPKHLTITKTIQKVCRIARSNWLASVPSSIFETGGKTLLFLSEFKGYITKLI